MIRPKHTAHALLVLVSMVVVSSVEAATLRVEQDGSGDFLAIQDAVDAAAVADTILIGPGEYGTRRPFSTDFQTRETFVGASVDSLVIRGTSREGVIVGPAVPPPPTTRWWGITHSREETTNLTVENLTVRNVREGIRVYHRSRIENVTVVGCHLGVVHVHGTGTVIRGLTVRDSGQTGITTGNGVRDVRVEDCELLRNATWGVSINRTINATVRDCVFTDGGLSFFDGTTGLASHCTIQGEGSHASLLLFARVTMNHCTIDSSVINISIKGQSHLSGTGNVLRGGSSRTMRFSGSSTPTFMEITF